MKHQLTVEDFDKARAVPWSTQTCLIAQADIRLHKKTTHETRWAIATNDSPAKAALLKFDLAFKTKDEALFAELRAELPIEFELP